MASFSDLPTELVLTIGSYLSSFNDISQVNLALTCRRFYAALIDMVLKDQIMEIEKLSSSSIIAPAIYNDPKAYQAAKKRDRTATHISPSEILLFDQEDIGHAGMLHIMISGMTRRELQSLRYLVSRAQHLKKLVIELYFKPDYSIQDLADFIGSCLSKPGLRLHIHGGLGTSEFQSPFIFHFNDLGSNRPQTKTINSTTYRPPEYINPSFSVTERKHDIHFYEESLLQPQISALALEGGEIPFMLPFYPAILNALRCSTITSLTLKWIPFRVSLFHWGQILPSITLPMLKDLTIGKASIPFPDLLSLLERHPTIEILDLTHNNVIGVVNFPSRPILPRLASLTANAEYLLPFIEHRTGGHFPVLKKLHTRPTVYMPGMTPENRFPYLDHDLHPVYDHLSSTKISAKNPSFHMTIGSDGSGIVGFTQWLLNMQSTPVAGKSDKSANSKSTPLAGVRTLVVEDAELWKAPTTTERLFEWFKTYRSNLDESIVSKEGFKDVMYKDMFEVLVWTTCLQLEKLEIAGNKAMRSYVRDFEFERRRVTKRR